MKKFNTKSLISKVDTHSDENTIWGEDGYDEYFDFNLYETEDPIYNMSMLTANVGAIDEMKSTFASVVQYGGVKSAGIMATDNMINERLREKFLEENNYKYVTPYYHDNVDLVTASNLAYKKELYRYNPEKLQKLKK